MIHLLFWLLSFLLNIIFINGEKLNTLDLNSNLELNNNLDLNSNLELNNNLDLTINSELNNNIIKNQLNFNIYGINYNVRQGPDWSINKCKNINQIENELTILKNITNNIKIFSLIDCNQGLDILTLSKKLNLKIWIGLWVSADKEVFIKEKNKLIDLINLKLIHSELILGINVGSESIYRKELTVIENIDYLEEIKQLINLYNLSIPVSIIDTIDIYNDNPILIEKSDILIFNQFPFWEKINLNNSIDVFANKVNKLQALNINNKEIIVGETGWSSNGFNNRSSEASPENQAIYFINFYKYATDINIKYFYFSSFDEPWKNIQNNVIDDVESHFGLFDINYNIKPDILNVIKEFKNEINNTNTNDTNNIDNNINKDQELIGIANNIYFSNTSLIILIIISYLLIN